MKDLKNLFCITHSPKGWVVTWPTAGRIHTYTHKELVLNYGVDTGTSVLTAMSSVGERIRITPADSKTYMLAVAIEMLQDVISLEFDTEQQAEAFVDLIEKHILWKCLSA